MEGEYGRNEMELVIIITKENNCIVQQFPVVYRNDYYYLLAWFTTQHRTAFQF